MTSFAIGLDYGTNSARGILVDTSTGEELVTAVFAYPHGTNGILLDPRIPDLARQHPQDYVDAASYLLSEIVRHGLTISAFDPSAIVGIGVDTTGSTPIPVDAYGTPLALLPDFADDLGAMAVLWKDHTAHAEASEITSFAAEHRPEYLAKCGGTYSSEWFWAKILRCARTSPRVFEAAATWVEHADWQTALLTGTTAPGQIRRCICAAGHKAMFNDDWGGYPDLPFLTALDPALASVRRTLPDVAYPIGEKAGVLTGEWAELTGLPEGIPVSMGAFDAHLGAVGSGIGPGVLVKIIGTSTCDMMVAPDSVRLPDIPGLCGIVDGSILPGYYGFEAGQSAVGDIFNWYVSGIGPRNLSHEALTAEAEKLGPGESGLLALDWHNGNRTILVDQRLTGSVFGLTLHTSPAELYRAWIEATAFGARVIMERFEEYKQHIDRIVNCGGIAAKNPLVMQIYADIMGRPIAISSSSQTCALGAAMAGAVAGEAHASFASAAESMTSLLPRIYTPAPARRAVYDRLFGLYRRLHDALGVRGTKDDLSDILKSLLDLRDEVRSA